MVFDRRVSFWEGLRYRGRGNMINWMLHRITGVGILIFVGTHVVVSFFGQQFGADLAFAINGVYESWPFQILVYFCVLFHAINGARVAVIDLFPGLMRFNRELNWLQWATFIPAYGLPVFALVRNALNAG